MVGKGVWAVLAALWVVGTVAITQKEYDARQPGVPSMLLEVDASSDPDGQKLDPTDPGVDDPATEEQFRHLSLHFKVPKASDVEFFPWTMHKKKFIGATDAQSIKSLKGNGPIYRIKKSSSQAADPARNVHKECPRQRCPFWAKCPTKNHFCCAAGNFSTCCPPGTVCLTTSPPTCLKEDLNTTQACSTEVCAAGFHCPLSHQGECCLGGQTCCPENARCTPDGHCVLLSHWDYLNKRQPPPTDAVHNIYSALTNNKTKPFKRAPFPVIPIHSTAPTAQPTASPTLAPTTPPTAGPTPAPTPKPLTAAQQLLKDCPKCNQSLFENPPTEPGTRTRQKAVMVGDKKMVITEMQTTVRTKYGGLKTTTQVHREVYQMHGNLKNEHLWPRTPPVVNIKAGLDKLHRQNDGGEVSYKPRKGQAQPRLQQQLP